MSLLKKHCVFSVLQLFPKVYNNICSFLFVISFQETMAQQMVHASIDLDFSLHLVFPSLILCFVKPKGGFNCPDRQHIRQGSRFVGFVKQKIWVIWD